MDIPTHRKGDVAVGFVIADLLKRGFNVFVPVSTHACHYDLVASFRDDNDIERVLRVQVKYGSFQRRKYADKVDPFDLFAVYFPEFDRLLYSRFDVSEHAGLKVSQQMPNSATPFFWWEDFKCPKQALLVTPVKRTVKEFGHKIRLNGLTPREGKIKIAPRDLQRLLWKQSLVLIAKDLGVSDRALGKRVKKLELLQPPSGYWARSPEKRKELRKRYSEQFKAVMAKL